MGVSRDLDGVCEGCARAAERLAVGAERGGCVVSAAAVVCLPVADKGWLRCASTSHLYLYTQHHSDTPNSAELSQSAAPRDCSRVIARHVCQHIGSCSRKGRYLCAAALG